MKIKYIILALFLTIICLTSLVYYNTSTVHKYKKLVKVYTNAVQNAVEQNGTIDNWKINNAGAFFQFIKTDLNIDKICRENDENESCFIKKYPRLNNMGN